MKVASNLALSLAVCASASSGSLATRSTLLRIRSFGCRTSASRSRIASFSSSRPLRASISTPTRSASCAPLQAVVTMARSSRRFGVKMPGVSTKMSCDWPATVMPRISARVVCTLCETMVTLEPTSALSSVDLPALGAPISATKPQRVSDSAMFCSGIDLVRGNADGGEHRGRRSLLRRALGCSRALPPAGGRAIPRRRGISDCDAVRCGASSR